MENKEGYLTGIKEWRELFSKKILEDGKRLANGGEWQYFWWNELSAKGKVRIAAKGQQWGEVTVKHLPQSYSDDWDENNFTCSCQKRRGYYFVKEMCVHEAALLFRLEKEHGPWKFTETEEERDERLENERIEKEIERRSRLEQEEGDIAAPIETIFPKREKGEPHLYYDLAAILKKESTSLYSRHRMEEILEDGRILSENVDVTYLRSGPQVLNCKMEIYDGLEEHEVSMIISRDKIEQKSCSCKNQYEYYYGRYATRTDLCEHQLVLLKRLWEHIKDRNPGDATDLKAENFFSMLFHSDIVLEEAEEKEVIEKEKKVLLIPRIIMEQGEPKLTFKIGMTGGKLFILKKFREFVEAVEQEKNFLLGKTLTIDFSAVTITDEGLPWLTFIQRRVGEIQNVNDRLNSRTSYYYYSSPTLSVQPQEPLKGAVLDRFYDLADGGDFEYQSKQLKIKGKIHVGHADMNVSLQTEKMTDASGEFLGVSVTGNMPVILAGVTDNYFLDENHLSRISKEEYKVLLPFRKVASESGMIQFHVGKTRLSEFYYRAVPDLLESRYVDFEDTCAEMVKDYLPPEPEFLFRLDMEDDICICRTSVAYSVPEASENTWKYSLPDGEVLKKPSSGAAGGAQTAEVYIGGGYRDELQEKRVIEVLEKSFAGYDKKWKGYCTEEDESGAELYRILTEVIPLLNRYGEVKGTDAFRMNAVKPVPQVRVGVSIDSGIMDISILSKDMEPEELLDVLQSYRKKKKYYRLKSGDFIDLLGDTQLASLDDMMTSLDLSSEDVIRGNAKLPAFRALYLDKMLEAHDELVADRNKTYRTLVKNFNTIRDADYEPTSGMEDVLRPYQLYGYKWLRTLAAVGFGGILADEMGLGKTLQMISMMAALFGEGEKSPGLIVCPASLVFNWQEEFSRFAPEISVCTVVGTVETRKQIFKEMKKQAENLGKAGAEKVETKKTEEEKAGDGKARGSSFPQVYITSYDLLRKDIAKYESMTFSVMVLDEAQYIKNQKAAMTKAVKVVRANHRFALTGTPIENKLAELWSIFDFLMPGFLYKYDEFSQKFEVPVTKEKNEEKANRLKQMVRPFILRRLKTDVLKDLPAKLEEVRYARFDEEQRKVYDGQVVHMKKMISGADNDRIKVFAELMRIRQICCDPSLFLENYKGGSAKRQACMDLVKSAIEGGHKILLFSQFTSMLSLLEDDLGKEGIPFYKITGSTPKENRVRLVRDFNENEVPVFLISLKAGGTGLNLTGADVVIHYDPWWNVAAQNQATDRAHRIGQKKQVTVYRLVVKDTIEEKILALQEAKKDLADAILSGESESIYTLSGEELLELL